jgi:hypothetical protein
MLRRTFTLIFGIFILCATSRGAINSSPDGKRHPALGSVCVKITETDPWMCVAGSGFLLSPDIVLSVAHAGPWLDELRPARIGITFDEKIGPTPKVYEASQFVPDPLFAWDVQDPHDLGVFIMLDRVTDIPPIRLPPVLNFLDHGHAVFNTYFTVVDRGLTTLEGWPDHPVWTSRVFGESVATELRTGALMVGPDGKHATQPCYGASGSVALLTHTNLAMGVGSWFADWTSDCKGPFGYTRLDTKQARDFLANYLPAWLLPKNPHKE